MNKKEASEYLGISIRQIENYAKQNRLSVRKEKGKTGDIAVYDENELKALKKELDSKRAPRPSIVIENEANSESREMIRASDSRLSDFSTLAEALIAISATKKAASGVAIENKPLLKIDEAATLTGLSRDTLRKAIEEKKLKGKIIGKAYRIKRADLDAYIQKL